MFFFCDFFLRLPLTLIYTKQTFDKKNKNSGISETLFRLQFQI